MSGMEALFALQDEDVLRGQLEYRRARLPEGDALVAVRAARTATTAEVEGLQVQRLEQARRQHRLEGDVAAIEVRLGELDQRLYGSAITSPKEATALQNEIEGLRRRQDDLEGEVLEIMEALIDGELAEAATRREAAGGSLPADLLARYERNLPSFGSSTVVRFSGADCSGCPYSMPAVEADRVKGLATGTLADCSECGRLVVR